MHQSSFQRQYSYLSNLEEPHVDTRAIWQTSTIPVGSHNLQCYKYQRELARTASEASFLISSFVQGALEAVLHSSIDASWHIRSILFFCHRVVI